MGEIEIDDESSVWLNCVLRGDVNFIKIGKRANVQDLTTIHVWCKEFNKDGGLGGAGFPTRIGDDITIGHDYAIYACKIGSRVFVGMDAVIINDVAIGDNSIVGASSMVTRGKGFLSKSLILGNPVKPIYELNDGEVVFLKQSALNHVESKNGLPD